MSLIHPCAPASGLPRPLTQGRSLFWTTPVLLKGLLGGWGVSGDREIPSQTGFCLQSILLFPTPDPVWEVGRPHGTLHQPLQSPANLSDLSIQRPHGVG